MCLELHNCQGNMDHSKNKNKLCEIVCDFLYVIGSTPTSLLNSSFVLLSFMEIPHIHLIICISSLSNFDPTSTSKGPSLTSISHTASDTTGIHSTFHLRLICCTCLNVNNKLFNVLNEAKINSTALLVTCQNVEHVHLS